MSIETNITNLQGGSEWETHTLNIIDINSLQRQIHLPEN
jgi:hypothetical protein